VFPVFLFQENEHCSLGESDERTIYEVKKTQRPSTKEACAISQNTKMYKQNSLCMDRREQIWSFALLQLTGSMV
jgi:hypothetical protein